VLREIEAITSADYGLQQARPDRRVASLERDERAESHRRVSLGSQRCRRRASCWSHCPNIPAWPYQAVLAFAAGSRTSAGADLRAPQCGARDDYRPWRMATRYRAEQPDLAWLKSLRISVRKRCLVPEERVLPYWLVTSRNAALGGFVSLFINNRERPWLWNEPGGNGGKDPWGQRRKEQGRPISTRFKKHP